MAEHYKTSRCTIKTSIVQFNDKSQCHQPSPEVVRRDDKLKSLNTELCMFLPSHNFFF